MIPRPPFASDLSLERELEEFERLKPRLLEVWDAIAGRDEAPHTSVVVPSLTLDQAELTKLDGASFYEERLLFLLIRLRNPRARVVFVTSQPVHPLVLEYYFQLLVGIPASHARGRLTLLCAHDASPRSLTEKILERPRLIERIRAGIPDRSRAYLTVFNSTPLERRLAVLLGIPLNGVDPALIAFGTKSGSRKVFREAGVACPEGHEDLRDDADLEAALVALKSRNPALRKAVVKLNDSFSGEGNAIFRYPGTRRPTRPRSARGSRRSSSRSAGRPGTISTRSSGAWAASPRSSSRARVKASPSVQLRTGPRGDVLPDLHARPGPRGPERAGLPRLPFPRLGRVPPGDRHGSDADRQGARLPRRREPVRRGLPRREGPPRTDPGGSSRWRSTSGWAGTTHPYLALQFLTGGRLDPDSGLFLSPRGSPKFYRATDNLQSEAYRGLLPEDLIEIVTINALHYSHNSESGVLFHLIGALSQYGKLGMTAIGNSREEVEALYEKTLRILDRETAIGR